MLQYEFGKGQKVDITESVMDYEWQSGFLQKVLLMSHRPDWRLCPAWKKDASSTGVVETGQLLLSSLLFSSLLFSSLLFSSLLFSSLLFSSLLFSSLLFSSLLFSSLLFSSLLFSSLLFSSLFFSSLFFTFLFPSLSTSGLAYSTEGSLHELQRLLCRTHSAR